MKDIAVIGGFTRVPAIWLRAVLVATLGLLLICAYSLTAGADEAGAEEAFTCHRWASPNGSDANDGLTQANAVQTVRTLADKLQPGQTGCLSQPDPTKPFYHDFSGWGIIANSGQAGSPITIRSAPGGTATLTGVLRVDGSHVVIRDLNFRGLGAVANTAPKTNHIHVIGDNVSLLNNDITSPKGICVYAGQIDGYATPEAQAATINSAQNFKLDGNRIYGCGVQNTLDPNVDSGVHGVYLGYTQNATITNNYIYDNRVRGLQLWPRAEGTLVANNVLDGNSGNFNIGGSAHEGGYYVSRDTTVKNNIISNSTFAFAKDSHQIFGNLGPNTSPTQYNNTVTENCVYHQDPTKNFGGTGYTQTNNITANPLYKDRANKDFTLAAGSPCTGKGPQPTTTTNTAPTITNPTPANGSATNDTTPNITAKVSDAQTELVEDNIDLYLDGSKLDHLMYGYNQTTDLLFHTPDQPLSQGAHTVKVVTTDAQGLSTTQSWSFKVDSTAPTVQPPKHSFTPLSTLGTSTVPVKLAWSATDNTGGSGIASYQLQQSVNGGTYSNVTLSSPTPITTSVSLTPGTNTYTYKVVAKDKAGNASTATGAPFKVTAYQESSAAIVDSSTWTTSQLTGAYGGSVQSASVSGMYATFTVPAGSKNVEWVSVMGNRGIAQVWLDGVQQDAKPNVTGMQNFDLYSSGSAQVRKVVFSKAVSPTTSHKLKVIVTGQKNASSTSTRVDIDAFVTTS